MVFKRIIFLLCLALILVLNSAYAQKCKPLSSKKITSYGLYLGMPASELKQKGFVAGLYVPAEKDNPSVIYTKKPAGKYEKINCWVYKDKVYRIELYFKDKSQTNYETLKKILNKKYGKGEELILTNAVAYITKIEGKEVHIYLDLAEVLDRYLKVIYVYECIDDKVDKEIERRKAERIKNEL